MIDRMAIALGAAALLAHAPLAQPRVYPVKPVRVIVPYAAGGFSDIIGRLVTERMARALGQSLVVEARPGGGGRIGADAVAKAPAYGYTILYTTNGTHSYMQVTEKNLPYAAVTHVPYKGSASAMQAVIAVEVYATFGGAAKPFIDAGKLRFLGTTSRARDPRFPDVRAIGEGGLTGFDLTYWIGIFGPARLPAEVQAKLNAAVASALSDESLQARMREMGVVPVGGSPEILPQRIRADVAALRQIVGEAKLKFD